MAADGAVPGGVSAGSAAARENWGLINGVLGVIAFAFTLPMTRIAVAELDPLFVGLGRGAVAAIPAALLLWLTGQRLPTRRQWGAIAWVAAGTVVGFPLFSALAMRQAPASHGAVVVGVLPLATAVAAVILARERPSAGFWITGIAGAAAVLSFVLAEGGGRVQPADVWLALAVASAAIGYALGGRLAGELGGWQVISWALVLAAPFVSIPALLMAPGGGDAGPGAWLGFGYVALVSQYLGFFFWYRGLAQGGVARVSQVQLLQPFLTLLAAALLLGEPLRRDMLLSALIVSACVAVGRRMPVRRV